MKMNMEVNYTCEICGTTYSILEKCQSCEEGHITEFQKPNYYYRPMCEDMKNRFPAGFWLVTKGGSEEAYYQRVRVRNT